MSKQNVPELRFPEFSGEWNSVSIQDLYEESYGGGTPKTSVKEYWNGNIPWIQSSDLTMDSLKTVNVRKHISIQAISNSATKLIPKNSIAIVTRVGVGKLAYIDHDFATSQDFISLSGVKSDVNFTLYTLYKLLKRESSALQGTSIKGITKKEFINKTVFVPELDEQKKIGDLLNKVDRLIELEEKKLELLEEQKKGYMQKIFSQELRFKDENGNDYPDWEERQLKEKSTYESSKISLSQVMEYEDGPYPVYDANKVIKYIETYDQKRAYISIIKDGAGVGRIVLCPSKSSIIGTMGYIKPVTIEPYYLYLQLQTINYSKYMVGSTIPHIYYKDYSKEKIKISSIREQKKISEFFKYLNNRVELIDRKISQLKIRKKALLQKMFV
ncbi:restriction endonuclease subunit S [Salinicoccus roseus]|uniref:restriction endonuclease subunit S n=1 Tax=Salinicoccus roseus TaxID=45670 RepID=UPI003DA161DA